MNADNEMNPETWLSEHGDYLFRYAMVRLSNRSAAEDVVQETFLAAMKAKERFDGKSPVRAWLMGILKHKVVDYIRKASREIQIEDFEAAEITSSLSFKYIGIPPGGRHATWRINPRKAFEQKEFWDVFSGCLSKLGGNMKAAFTLKELEGWTTEEVCKELQVQPNNLWVILHRARNALKECLETNWTQKTQGKAV